MRPAGARGGPPGLHQRLPTDRAVAYLPRLGLRPHIHKLVQTAWTLGGRPHLATLRLRPWAHQLGFGGHWSTRSRRYSTTMTALRRVRLDYKRTHGHTRTPLDAWGRPETHAVVVLKQYTFAGRGWRSQAERWLATQAAARAREHRRTARHTRAAA